MAMVQRQLILILAFLLGGGAAVFAESDSTWNQFRGPGGQGNVTATDFPVEFGEESNLKWKTPVPGVGWSSPVVADEEIWLTSAVEDADAQEYSLRAIGLDSVSGRVIQNLELFRIPTSEEIHGDNSYASPSPVSSGEIVVFHFGTYGTAAWNRKTKSIAWKLDQYKVAHQGGPGSSPVAYEDLIILTYDGADGQYVVAVDRETGKERWKTNRTAPQRDNKITRRAFATPAICQLGGEDLLISPAADQVHAYVPATGAEKWHVRYTGFSNVPLPVTYQDQVFVCTGFYETEILAISAGGSANVTETHVSWRYDRSVSTVPSPIVIEDKLYTINEEGLLTCLDCVTGEVLGRRRMNGKYSASPIHHSGKIYFCEDSGRITIVSATPEMPTIQVNRVTGQLKATPAAFGNELLLRSDTHVYCFTSGNPSGK